MRTTFFFFAMLAGITASAQITNVEPVSANYANKTVSFRVWWNAGSRDATHLSKIWVWVDYLTVNSNNTTSGNTWTRATVGTVSPATGISYDGNNRNGFWLDGNASTNYSATLTVQLTNAPAKFNWCAYVSDYPPNATIDNGTYTLKGSPPFKITYNGSSYTETFGKNFTLGCIASLTDATGCPGIINYPAFSAGALGNGSWGSMGEFLNVGGTPLTIVSTTAAGGGSGKITYQWYKNNTEISGATATTYLPPKADATVAGTFNYTRKAYDGVCNTAGNAASGTWTNIVGGPIHTYTGCSIYVAMYDITTKYDWSTADANCKSLGSGWRLPTCEESVNCMGPNRWALNLMDGLQNAARNYWTSDETIAVDGAPECIGQLAHIPLGVSTEYVSEWGGEYTSWCNPNWGNCGVATWIRTRCVKNK